MARILAGPETQVNSFTPGSQVGQKIATLEGGGWVVTWSSFGQSGTEWDVYSQVYTASGVKLGGETRVNSYTTSLQFIRDVAALEDGGWVVTWDSVGQDGSSYGVYQQAYDASGRKVGVETRVNSHTTGYQFDSQVAALEGGGWVVVWQSDDQDGDLYGLYQQAYGASGSKSGSETQVNTFTAGHQFGLDIAALEGGGWVVVWQSDGQDGDGWGVYQQAYNAAGIILGGETRINDFTSGSQIGVQVAALEGGGWFVTWQSDGQDGSGSGVYGQAYSALGVEVGGQVQINSFTTGAQSVAEVAALAGGGWVATWRSDGQDGDLTGIYCQAFASNGNRIGGETRVNSFAAGEQTEQEVTALAGGGWVVTWISFGQDGDVWGVYQQAFRPDGSKDGVETRVNTFTTNVQGGQEVAALPDGGWVVTWGSEGQDGDGGGVYQKVFKFDQPPTAVSLSDASVKENKKAGAVVGTLSGSDPEGSPLGYALVSNPGGRFEIVGNKLRTTKKLDFEKDKSHVVTIEAIDDGGLKISKGFTITVKDRVEIIEGNGNNNKLAGANGADDIRGLGGNDTLKGKGRDDKLSGGGGKDKLSGGGGKDKLYGGKGNDKLHGGKHDDKLSGGSGTDKLEGGKGGDRLSGGKGQDKLEGGRGGDKLSGGKHADTFVFKSIKDSTVKKDGRDVITDFKRGQDDKIHLGAIDARSGSKKDHAFDFIGKKKFSGDKGDLRYETKKGKTFVYGDVNGDKKADFAIELSKAMDLKKADFVL